VIKPSDIVFVIKSKMSASLFMARYARLRQEQRIGTEIPTPNGIGTENLIITDYDSFIKALNKLWDRHLIDARSRDSMVYGDAAKAVEKLFGLCDALAQVLRYIPILNKQRNSLKEVVIAEAPIGSLNWEPIFILKQQAPGDWTFQ
jgi:hypothetical protein